METMEVEGGGSGRSGSNCRGICAILIAVGIVVGLIVIILPLSFKPLEYYEYGFRRRATTGVVDKSKVYTGGLHLIGPDYEFKKFSASAHFVSFQRVTVFAADRLQVKITAMMQYFLRKEQLVQLHENYDLRYSAIVESNALDALKAGATVFFTRDFIHKREEVESHLFKVIKERLGGNCCERDCDKGQCLPRCSPLVTCKPKDSGLFVEVRYFQLHKLEIPEKLKERFQQSIILGESTESEKLKQTALIIRKETEALAKQTENQATEISQNATALSALEVARADADATAMVELARGNGLRHLYTELRLTTQESKLAYDYLKTLRRQSNVNLAVDYNQLVSVARALT